MEESPLVFHKVIIPLIFPGKGLLSPVAKREMAMEEHSPGAIQWGYWRLASCLLARHVT